MKKKKIIICLMCLLLLLSVNITNVLAKENDKPAKALGEPTLLEQDTSLTLVKSSDVLETSETVIDNTQQNRTKEEIKSKYLNAKTTVTLDTVFEEEPIVNGPNYKEGTLSSLAKSDVLKQLNFYRYLAGAPEVQIFENYMSNNGKGAVLLSASDFAHEPSKPSDMSDEFYKLAIYGTRYPIGTGYGVSGNISGGAFITNSIKGYIDDTDNLVLNSVGHRLSLINPKAVGTSFGFSVGDSSSKTSGFYNQYTAFTMYHESSSSKGKFYTWPPAGYCPTEVTAANELWSITLDSNYSINTSNMKIILVCDDVEYPVDTEIFKSYSSYNSFYFALPKKLNDVLISGDRYASGKKVTVNVTGGIIDSNANNVDINYDIEFFVAEEIPITDFTIYQRDLGTSGYYWSFYNSLSGYVNGGKELFIEYTPTNTSQTGLSVDFSDPTIASYDKIENMIYFNKAGTTICTISSISNPNVKKSFYIYVKNYANVEYKTHVQNVGWQDYVSNGKMSGTSGKSLGLEGIKIKIDSNLTGGIEYSSNIQDIGWQDYVSNDEMSGTSGRALRLEAIKIRLTGEIANYYDVYYRVHAQNAGWLGWAKNGQESGTEGYDFRLEGIEIKLVEKGQNAPGSTSNTFMLKPPTVEYTTHVQNIGWQDYVSNGKMAGTSGKALRLEGIKIRLADQRFEGNIEYRTHVQNIGWQDYVSNDEMSGTSGRSLRLEAINIRLTGELAEKYDIYYRVHAQNAGWLGWAKNDEPSGTAGYGFRLEGIEIKIVQKGDKAPGSTEKAFVQP